jgi:hypothetical protein
LSCIAIRFIVHSIRNASFSHHNRAVSSICIIMTMAITIIIITVPLHRPSPSSTYHMFSTAYHSIRFVSFEIEPSRLTANFRATVYSYLKSGRDLHSSIHTHCTPPTPSRYVFRSVCVRDPRTCTDTHTCTLPRCPFFLARTSISGLC